MDLARFRQEKDAFFRESDSPLTGEQRKNFSGLQYFSEKNELRFTLFLDTDVAKELVTVQTSTGSARQYQRAGKIRFVIAGTSVELTVFQDANGYFLPFRDGTCEKESYGAGRYVEPDREGNDIVVDFNLAYNPYCAYNEKYSCPIPPKENWTPARIEAGEQRFHP